VAGRTDTESGLVPAISQVSLSSRPVPPSYNKGRESNLTKQKIFYLFLRRCKLRAISALSAGHDYLMRIVLLLSRGHRLCRFARRRNKGNLHPPRRSLSAISAISVGLLVSHADSVLLSRSHRLCRFARRSHRLCRFARRRTMAMNNDRP